MSAVDETRFEALGQEWTARFDFNAICRIEETFDKPFVEAILALMPAGLDAIDLDDPAKIAAAAARIRLGDVRLLLREGLLGTHPGVTLEQTGDLIQALGVQKAIGIVAAGMMSALGNDSGDEGGDAKGGANPRPRPKGRTGSAR